MIGTGYSGNLQFMNESNSCLVNYRLLTFHRARIHMRMVNSGRSPMSITPRNRCRKLLVIPFFASNCNARGQEFVRSQMSPAAASHALSSELQRIREMLAS